MIINIKQREIKINLKSNFTCNVYTDFINDNTIQSEHLFAYTYFKK